MSVTLSDPETLWAQTKPIASTTSLAFLRSKTSPKLEIQSEDVRHLPRDDGPGALAIAIRTATEKLVGVQLIEHDGRRCVVGSERGHMRLSHPCNAVVIGVEVEEAIIAGVVMNTSAIAVVNDAELARVRLPDGVKWCLIAHASKANGMPALAASELAARLWSQGVPCAFLPPAPGFATFEEMACDARTQTALRRKA